MKDVAQRASVSTMTVSLVLSGKSGAERISEETRQRVLNAARELRYLPNARGRALRSGRTNIIGLYAGFGFVNVRLPFFTEVVSGLQEGCEQVKKDLLLHGVFHGDTPDAIFNELVDGRIDGLVVSMPPDSTLAQRLADSPFPVVAVADPLPGVPSITVDDKAGSRMIVEHLHERGHSRVAYLSSQVRPLSTVRRRQAFLSSAAELRMEVTEHVFDPHAPGTEPIIPALLEIPVASRPTAIACWNDDAAFEIVSECRRFGIRVPDEMAVVGFDGTPFHCDPDWKLTTVRAPWAQAARTAVLYLAEIMEGRQVPQDTILPVELLLGQTS
jgi:DNA-binding LacI/PurR family transcriptional regulator